MNPSPAIILYDGECGFCRRMAYWVAERNQQGRLLLATLQGEAAVVLGEKRNTEQQSVVVWEGSRRKEGAAAVWVILQRIDGPWSWMAYLGRILPECWANFGYRWIAQRRHRWQRDSERKHLSLFHLAE